MRNLAVGLTILFIVLKGTGYVDWSWLTVWAPLGLYYIVAVVIAVLASRPVDRGGWQ